MRVRTGIRRLVVTLAILVNLALPFGSVVAQGVLSDDIGIKRWALLVGIDSYKDETIPPLRAAVKDVYALKGLLEKRNFNVQIAVKEDAIATDVIAKLENMIDNAGDRDLVVFYFSGHGVVKGEKAYLITYDAEMESNVRFGKTTINVEDVATTMQRTEGTNKKIVLILDNCFSGAFASSGQVASKVLSSDSLSVASLNKQINQILGSRNRSRVTITSSTSGEKSYEMPDDANGVFTHFLLQALTGAADDDWNGIITARELGEYVRREVPVFVRNNSSYFGGYQTPTLDPPDGGADIPIIATEHLEKIRGLLETEFASQNRELDFLITLLEKSTSGESRNDNENILWLKLKNAISLDQTTHEYAFDATARTDLLGEVRRIGKFAVLRVMVSPSVQADIHVRDLQNGQAIRRYPDDTYPVHLGAAYDIDVSPRVASFGKTNRNVSVSRREEDVLIELPVAGVSVRLRCDPDDATVSLRDSASHELSPAGRSAGEVRYLLLPGSYIATVERAGYDGRSVSIGLSGDPQGYSLVVKDTAATDWTLSVAGGESAMLPTIRLSAFPSLRLEFPPDFDELDRTDVEIYLSGSTGTYSPGSDGLIRAPSGLYQLTATWRSDRYESLTQPVQLPRPTPVSIAPTARVFATPVVYSRTTDLAQLRNLRIDVTPTTHSNDRVDGDYPTFRLMAGEYRIVATAEGYEPLDTKRTLGASSPTMEWIPIPLMYQLRIERTTPTRAIVSVKRSDGSSAAQTGDTYSLPTGRYVIEATAPNCLPYSNTIFLDRDTTVDVRLRFELTVNLLLRASSASAFGVDDAKVTVVDLNTQEAFTTPKTTRVVSPERRRDVFELPCGFYRVEPSPLRGYVTPQEVARNYDADYVETMEWSPLPLVTVVFALDFETERLQPRLVITPLDAPNAPIVAPPYTVSLPIGEYRIACPNPPAGYSAYEGAFKVPENAISPFGVPVPIGHATGALRVRRVVPSSASVRARRLVDSGNSFALDAGAEQLVDVGTYVIEAVLRFSEWEQPERAQQEVVVLDRQVTELDLTLPGYFALPDGKTGLRIAKIPGGALTRVDGSTTPVPSFEMGATEVTVGQFNAFVSATNYSLHPMSNEDLNLPVSGISWIDAKAFCDWAGVRLPTVDEWEYAASGGRNDSYATADGTIGAQNANTADSRSDGPALVGSFPPNPFRLYEMTGNVVEWCSDLFEPTDDYPNAARAMRGGSWIDTEPRNHSRFRGLPTERMPTYGFRVVLPTKSSDR